MKTGNFLAGITIGALVGVGIGYALGIDSEKKNQWLKTINEKLKSLKHCNCSGEEGSCSCGKEEKEKEKESE